MKTQLALAFLSNAHRFTTYNTTVHFFREPENIAQELLRRGMGRKKWQDTIIAALLVHILTEIKRRKRGKSLAHVGVQATFAVLVPTISRCTSIHPSGTWCPQNGIVSCA